MTICINKDFIFSGSYDGIIKKWNKKLELLHSWQAHDIVVYSMVCDDNDRLFSSSTEGEIKEWDLNGEFRQMTILQTPVTSKTADVKALVLKNGLLYGGDDGGNLVEWDQNFKVNKHKFTYNAIWSLAASPDGKFVLTVRDNDVMINDICKWNISWIFVIFKPFLLTAVGNTRKEFAQTVAVESVLQGRAPVVIDAQNIACPERAGLNISVYAYQKGFPLKGTLKDGHDMIITALLQSPDCIISAGWDHKIIYWDIGTMEKKKEFICETYINTLCWYDTTKKQVLAGGKNGYLTIVQF